ncbi:MAG TPA: hypothetical protein PKY29_04400 [Ferruginibacter sp.]|nr:hypothetical protein [Ferruginibacter sp.]HRQ20529.1 hypothetical protein [Ferruginibacter sp.]
MKFKVILYCIIAALLFSACKLTEKAVDKKLEKFQEKFPAKVALKARELNPCIKVAQKTDSTAFLQYKDSLLKVYNTLMADDGFLIDEITGGSPITTDSCNEATFNKVIASLKEKHKNEMLKIISNPPVITVETFTEDSAAIRLTMETCQKVISMKEKQYEKEKKKAKSEARWKNISFGMNIALVIIAFLLGWLLKRR